MPVPRIQPYGTSHVWQHLSDIAFFLDFFLAFFFDFGLRSYLLVWEWAPILYFARHGYLLSFLPFQFMYCEWLIDELYP